MEVNLVFIKKDGTTQTFLLPSAVTFIGRRQDCDMCIPLSVVSRRHCEVYLEYGKVNVRNLKSSNGTYVNEKSIEEVQVKAGDVLRIGPVKFVFQIDGVPENFDEFLPSPVEQASQPQPTASQGEEPKELSDIDEDLEDLPNGVGGESQTMEIDDIFNNDFLGDDDFDLDSDLP